MLNMPNFDGRKPRNWMAVAVFAALLAAPPLPAQTYSVLHNFTGGGDGANPTTGLIIDQSGSLYGTTAPALLQGGSGNGNVFKMKKQGSNWLLSPLYQFRGGSDGSEPFGQLAFAHDGTIYGTTYYGGGTGCGGTGCGTVFHLRPSATRPATPLTPWNETVLYQFTGGADGDYPSGPLTFDSSGVIYGIANRGAMPGCGGGTGGGCGTAFTLTPSGGSYSFNVIWTFGNGDQGHPLGGLAFDSSGDLFGAAAGCYAQGGDVFQLVRSGSNWTENIIPGNMGGSCPLSGLIRGSDGNFYGATGVGSGSVFVVSNSGGTWTTTPIFNFTGAGGSLCGPYGALLRDSAGNIYGTTICDGANQLGSVFKLAPSGGGQYTYTDLHDFAGTDGALPYSNLVMDSEGNLYGTTNEGGTGTACAGGCGVVFEISPQ